MLTSPFLSSHRSASVNPSRHIERIVIVIMSSSTDNKKARKLSTGGAPKRDLVTMPEETEPEPVTTAPTAPTAPTPEDAERIARADKKAMLARVKERYQKGAGTASQAPVNVVDSAKADAHGFPSLTGLVHSASVDLRDPCKVHVDLIPIKIVAPTGSVLVVGDYLHAIYTQKPAIDPSAPPKAKSAGQITEKHDRILNETPLFKEITSHAYVTYTRKSDDPTPPPGAGSCIMLVNVEPKRGMKGNNETDIYLNCTGGFRVVGAPRQAHSAVGDYLTKLQTNPRIAAALAQDLLKAAGGVVQFVDSVSTRDEGAPMSAGEEAIISYAMAIEKKRIAQAARLEQNASRLPPREPDREGKAEGLRAIAKKLREDDTYELPTSESKSGNGGVSSFVVVQRGGRGGGRFEGTTLTDVDEDPRIVDLFDESAFAAVPETFAKTQLAYKPMIQGKLITLHFLPTWVLSSKIPPEAELLGDSSGIIKSVASPGSSSLTPTCGFKMTTAVAGINLGVLSSKHLESLLSKYMQHIPYAALVKTGDRVPYATDEPIDVDWVKGWVPDVPGFLVEMGVRVGKDWALKNVANGRANFPAMMLEHNNSHPTPKGHARPHIATHGFANLLEANGVAPEDLNKDTPPDVLVRYYMLPLGSASPEQTPPVGTSRLAGEEYMDKLISESGKDPRAFFEEGLCLPYAVLVAKSPAA